MALLGVLNSSHVCFWLGKYQSRKVALQNICGFVHTSLTEHEFPAVRYQTSYHLTTAAHLMNWPVSCYL